MKTYLEFKIITQLVILIMSSVLILFVLTLFYSDCFSDSFFLSWFAIEPYIFSKNNPFVDFYQQNLRGYLFSGFISVGSFLLSLHTFVISNIKDKVYLTVEYQKIFADCNNCNIEDIDKQKLLKPLDNLSWFINWSITLAILTAILQFTLGLCAKPLASLICVFFSILTIIFMLNALLLIRINIKIMLHQYRNNASSI
ncbi:hypothetical protein GASC598B02_008840 [Gilliamella apicola SCGC AB-598-B02]|nr:hypothetical protein GASC598B02_008840 [Gilliamella apicola SCGC AB-598-B02]